MWGIPVETGVFICVDDLGPSTRGAEEHSGLCGVYLLTQEYSYV